MTVHVVAAIRALEHDVAAHEHLAVAGERDRRVPVEAPSQNPRGKLAVRFGVGRHVRGLAGARVPKVDLPGVGVRRRRPDQVGVLRIDDRPHAVARPHRIPVAIHHADAVGRRRRAAPRVVVLQPYADAVIQRLRPQADVIRLRKRQIVGLPEVRAAVGREDHAFVAAVDDAPSVGRPPDRVIVPAGSGRDRMERAAAVGAHRENQRHVDQAVGVRRIDEDAAEVEGARAEIRAVRHASPRRAAVVGAPQFARPRLHRGVDPAAAPGRQADTAGEARRQAVTNEFAPRRAAVVGAIDAALRTAAIEPPRSAANLPHAGEQRRRPAGSAHERRHAARRPGVERARPVSAGVAR